MNVINSEKAKFDALKAEIFDHAARQDVFARPRQVRNALKALYSPDWEFEWQEALILLSCLCRMQPARTHGKLYMLRSARAERGEETEFDAFMTRVEAALHPDYITPHGYVRTFSEMDAQEIFNSMGAAVAPLAGLGNPVFLYAGALLGHIRSGRLIGHDDDIDVGIMLGECTAAQAAVRWLEFKQRLADEGMIDAEEKARNRPVFKFMSDLRVDIDLFPAWTDQGRFSVYPYSQNEMPENAVFPLASFGQDPLMLPADSEAMLVQSYGEGWRVPDPLFHLDWKRRNKVFQDLFTVNYALETAGDTTGDA